MQDWRFIKILHKSKFMGLSLLTKISLPVICDVNTVFESLSPKIKKCTLQVIMSESAYALYAPPNPPFDVLMSFCESPFTSQLTTIYHRANKMKSGWGHSVNIPFDETEAAFP